MKKYTLMTIGGLFCISATLAFAATPAKPTCKSVGQHPSQLLQYCDNGAEMTIPTGVCYSDNGPHLTCPGSFPGTYNFYCCKYDKKTKKCSTQKNERGTWSFDQPPMHGYCTYQ